MQVSFKEDISRTLLTMGTFCVTVSSLTKTLTSLFSLCWLVQYSRKHPVGALQPLYLFIEHDHVPHLRVWLKYAMSLRLIEQITNTPKCAGLLWDWSDKQWSRTAIARVTSLKWQAILCEISPRQTRYANNKAPVFAGVTWVTVMKESFFFLGFLESNISVGYKIVMDSAHNVPVKATVALSPVR